MDHREADLIHQDVKRPELAERDLVFSAQPAGGVQRRGRHVQMQGHVQLAEDSPLGQGLELINRLAGFDLDCALQPPPPFRAIQQKIRKNRQLSHSDRLILLTPWIDDDVVLTLVPGLQLPNDAIVLELLADGPSENRAHDASGLRETRHYSTRHSPAQRK